MHIGVLNNHGIQFSSKPLLKTDADFSRTEIGHNVSFKGIVENKTKLIRNDNHEISLNFTESIAAAETLVELLKLSEKQSMVSFVYSKESDLVRAQSVFIEIGEHMLEFCESVN